MSRTITVEIPDDDEAEGLVRRISAQLYDGRGVIVFPRPAEIAPESMPAIVEQMAIYLRTQAVVSHS